MQRTDCAARMFHPFSRSGGSGSSGNRMMNIWLSGSRHMLRIDRRPRACQGMVIYSQHVSRKSNATRNARYGDRNGLRRAVALRDRARWRSIIARLAPRESATRPRRSAALVLLCTDNGGTAKVSTSYIARRVWRSRNSSNSCTFSRARTGRHCIDSCRRSRRCDRDGGRRAITVALARRAAAVRAQRDRRSLRPHCKKSRPSRSVRRRAG